MFKKIGMTLSIALMSFASTSFALDLRESDVDDAALEISDEGVKVYSGYMKLVCDTPETCGNYSSGFHKGTVYKKVKLDIPPSTEMRVYWKENVPAGIAAGQYVAHTIGQSCGNGKSMTAKWFLTSGGAPYYAQSKDCNGVTHGFNVLRIDF